MATPTARRPRSRLLGQSLVEFALVLPIILLLLLVSLDFGRVFLGYINVQNMARIAANFAANHPDAWGVLADTTVQGQYDQQVIADASASNCRLPVAAGKPVVPDPTFVDRTGDGQATGLGDNAVVSITCTFDIITPLISGILGGSLPVTAEADFPVKTGMSAVPGGSGGGTPVLPTAAFTGNGVVSTRTAPYPALSNVSPFDVEFRDTSGGAPSTWYWEFDDGFTSNLQDPLVHRFECLGTDPCTFDVSMTASNANGSSIAHMTVTVLPVAEVDFSASRTLAAPGMSITFTDASASGGTNWAWDFGDGTTISGTNTTPSHAYANPGTYSVSLTVTYPDGDRSVTKAGLVTVQIGLCTVPDLGGVKFNDADAKFRGAPYKFTGHVLADTGAPNGNFTITAQDLTATSLAPCTSNIKVTRP